MRRKGDNMSIRRLALLAVLAASAMQCGNAKGSSQACTGSSNCAYNCPEGNCTPTCQDSSMCNSSCSGGGCSQTCLNNASCNFSCSGGRCTQRCNTTGTCTTT